jgi:hypothetical protein
VSPERGVSALASVLGAVGERRWDGWAWIEEWNELIGLGLQMLAGEQGPEWAEGGYQEHPSDSVPEHLVPGYVFDTEFAVGGYASEPPGDLAGAVFELRGVPGVRVRGLPGVREDAVVFLEGTWLEVTGRSDQHGPGGRLTVTMQVPDEPDQYVPDQDEPDQDEPDQDEPDQDEPDQDVVPTVGEARRPVRWPQPAQPGGGLPGGGLDPVPGSPVGAGEAAPDVMPLLSAEYVGQLAEAAEAKAEVPEGVVVPAWMYRVLEGGLLIGGRAMPLPAWVTRERAAAALAALLAETWAPGGAGLPRGAQWNALVSDGLRVLRGEWVTHAYALGLPEAEQASEDGVLIFRDAVAGYVGEPPGGLEQVAYVISGVPAMRAGRLPGAHADAVIFPPGTRLQRTGTDDLDGQRTVTLQAPAAPGQEDVSETARAAHDRPAGRTGSPGLASHADAGPGPDYPQDRDSGAGQAAAGAGAELVRQMLALRNATQQRAFQATYRYQQDWAALGRSGRVIQVPGRDDHFFEALREAAGADLRPFFGGAVPTVPQIREAVAAELGASFAAYQADLRGHERPGQRSVYVTLIPELMQAEPADQPRVLLEVQNWIRGHGHWAGQLGDLAAQIAVSLWRLPLTVLRPYEPWDLRPEVTRTEERRYLVHDDSHFSVLRTGPDDPPPPAVPAVQFQIPAGINRAALMLEFSSALGQLHDKVLAAAEWVAGSQRDELLSRVGLLHADVQHAQAAADAAVWRRDEVRLTDQVLRMIEHHLQLSRMLTEARTRGRNARPAQGRGRNPRPAPARGTNPRPAPARVALTKIQIRARARAEALRRGPGRHLPPPQVAADGTPVQQAVERWWNARQRGEAEPLNDVLKAKSVLNYKTHTRHRQAQPVLQAVLRQLIADDPELSVSALAGLLGINENTVAKWLPGRAGESAERVPPALSAANDALVRGTVDSWWAAYQRGEPERLNDALKLVLGYKSHHGSDLAQAVLRIQLARLVDDDPLITNARLGGLLGISEDLAGRWRPTPAVRRPRPAASRSGRPARAKRTPPPPGRRKGR